jgi:hypothetical protein
MNKSSYNELNNEVSMMTVAQPLLHGHPPILCSDDENSVLMKYQDHPIFILDDRAQGKEVSSLSWTLNDDVVFRWTPHRLF